MIKNYNMKILLSQAGNACRLRGKKYQKQVGAILKLRTRKSKIVQQIYAKMDHYAKLRKVMQNNNHKEFAKKLDHALPVVKKQILNELVLDLANIDATSFEVYFDTLLQCDLDINFVSRLKNKDPEFMAKTLLMGVSQNREFQMVKILLSCKKVSFQIQDDHGENALFYALRNHQQENSYQIINAILLRSPELSRSRNRHGISILHAALKKDSIRIVELLLKHSADPNQRCSQQGNASLHHTMLTSSKSPQKMKDLVLLLLSYNADPNIPNFNRDTSFDIANKIGFDLKRLVNLFEYQQVFQEEINACENQLNQVTKDENSEEDDEDIDDSEAEDRLPFSSQLLSQQMLTFAEECQKKIYDAWDDIQEIYYKLAEIGAKMNFSIDIIGSYAMTIWTPASDIDIVFTNLSWEEIIVEESLAQIYEILWNNRQKLKIKQIFLNKSLSFPNIKIQLGNRLNRRKIDITIFQKRNNGMKYVNFVRDGLSRYPIIKPLFYTLHRALQTFQIHNPAKGGIKTYALYLMIEQIVKFCEHQNIGEAFVKLVYYYAHCYDYRENIDQNGEMLLKMDIADPLNPKNNLGGKKTKIQEIRQMFRVIDYGFRMAEGKDILGYIFTLNSMFNCTE